MDWFQLLLLFFFFFICGGFCQTLKWNSHGLLLDQHRDLLLWLEDLILSRCQYYSKWSIDSLQFLSVFWEPFIYLFICWTTEKAYSQNHLELQRVLNNNNKKTWKRRTHLESLYFLLSKHYKATVIKTVWYWHILGYTNQWTRVASLGKKNPHIYDQFIFSKNTNSFQWGKE